MLPALRDLLDPLACLLVAKAFQVDVGFSLCAAQLIRGSFANQAEGGHSVCHECLA